jgi:hypothetical protein
MRTAKSRIRGGGMSVILVPGLILSVANADFTFGTPTNLGPTVNSQYGEALPSISADGLMLYFSSDRPDGYGNDDLWVAKRPTIEDDWGTPENLGPSVNSSQWEYGPCISADGLGLYFGLYNPAGYYIYDIWMAKRPTSDDAWGMPMKLDAPVNTSGVEDAAQLSADGLELYFAAYNRAGGYGTDDIWVTRRATRNDPWGPPENLGVVVNSSASDDHPCLSPDGLALFFSGDRVGPLHPARAGGFGNADMWVTTRSSISESWSTPINLGPVVNSTSDDGGPAISPDGITLYFSSERPGGFGGPWGDLYQAPISPVVDFNGDGEVDGFEVGRMAACWGTDDSSCDIGPMPWGNGLVDVEDLFVLAGYVGVPIDDPTLVAHWAFDETEGAIVADSTARCDGTAHGSPVWEPDAGQIDGALRFDGIDDRVSTPFVLDPSNGPFSVLAWIKGSTPGQTIVSQIEGENWICMEPTNGCLMTELKGAGRGGGALGSEAAVADGSWHRIGLVWEGECRTLYVDGVVVAQDTQAGGPPACTGGLYIGAGKGLEPGIFWSGLIDDVRIYNRAVKP